LPAFEPSEKRDTQTHYQHERCSYSVPQNSFPLPTGSILSFAMLGSALGKDYAGAIATLFCGTL